MTIQTPIAENCLHADVRVGYGKDGQQCVYLGEEDVSEAIRAAEVSLAASSVSTVPAVRARMVALQREIAKGHSVVMDGRDIGTKVLPNATLKVFLTASAAVRARRRFEELARKGMPEPYDKVLEELIRRDEIDTHRAASPPAQGGRRGGGRLLANDAGGSRGNGRLPRASGFGGESVKTWLYDFLKPIVRAYYFLVRGIRATGTENVASPGGYILCSNHVSASDPFVLATCARRRLHFMAKAELFKNRIVGGFISAIGAFPRPPGRERPRRGARVHPPVKRGPRGGHLPPGHPQPRERPYTTGAGRGAHRPARRLKVVPAYIDGPYRLFRKTRVVFGAPVSLEDLGRHFDRATLDQATARLDAAIWALKPDF